MIGLADKSSGDLPKNISSRRRTISIAGVGVWHLVEFIVIGQRDDSLGDLPKNISS